jgi:hypothetical protein
MSTTAQHHRSARSCGHRRDRPARPASRTLCAAGLGQQPGHQAAERVKARRGETRAASPACLPRSTSLSSTSCLALLATQLPKITVSHESLAEGRRTPGRRRASPFWPSSAHAASPPATPRTTTNLNQIDYDEVAPLIHSRGMSFSPPRQLCFTESWNQSSTRLAWSQTITCMSGASAATTS